MGHQLTTFNQNNPTLVKDSLYSKEVSPITETRRNRPSQSHKGRKLDHQLMTRLQPLLPLLSPLLYPLPQRLLSLLLLPLLFPFPQAKAMGMAIPITAMPQEFPIMNPIPMTNLFPNVLKTTPSPGVLKILNTQLVKSEEHLLTTLMMLSICIGM